MLIPTYLAVCIASQILRSLMLVVFAYMVQTHRPDASY